MKLTQLTYHRDICNLLLDSGQSLTRKELDILSSSSFSGASVWRPENGGGAAQLMTRWLFNVNWADNSLGTAFDDEAIQVSRLKWLVGCAAVASSGDSSRGNWHIPPIPTSSFNEILFVSISASITLDSVY